MASLPPPPDSNEINEINQWIMKFALQPSPPPSPTKNPTRLYTCPFDNHGPTSEFGHLRHCLLTHFVCLHCDTVYPGAGYLVLHRLRCKGQKHHLKFRPHLDKMFKFLNFLNLKIPKDIFIAISEAEIAHLLLHYVYNHIVFERPLSFPLPRPRVFTIQRSGQPDVIVLQCDFCKDVFSTAGDYERHKGPACYERAFDLMLRLTAHTRESTGLQSDSLLTPTSIKIIKTFWTLPKDLLKAFVLSEASTSMSAKARSCSGSISMSSSSSRFSLASSPSSDPEGPNRCNPRHAALPYPYSRNVRTPSPEPPRFRSSRRTSNQSRSRHSDRGWTFHQRRSPAEYSPRRRRSPSNSPHFDAHMLEAEGIYFLEHEQSLNEVSSGLRSQGQSGLEEEEEEELMEYAHQYLEEALERTAEVMSAADAPDINTPAESMSTDHHQQLLANLSEISDTTLPEDEEEMVAVDDSNLDEQDGPDEYLDDLLAVISASPEVSALIPPDSLENDISGDVVIAEQNSPPIPTTNEPLFSSSLSSSAPPTASHHDYSDINNIFEEPSNASPTVLSLPLQEPSTPSSPPIRQLANPNVQQRPPPTPDPPFVLDEMAEDAAQHLQDDPVHSAEILNNILPDPVRENLVEILTLGAQLGRQLVESNNQIHQPNSASSSEEMVFVNENDLISLFQNFPNENQQEQQQPENRIPVTTNQPGSTSRRPRRRRHQPIAETPDTPEIEMRQENVDYSCSACPAFGIKPFQGDIHEHIARRQCGGSLNIHLVKELQKFIPGYHRQTEKRQLLQGRTIHARRSLRNNGNLLPEGIRDGLVWVTIEERPAGS